MIVWETTIAEQCEGIGVANFERYKNFYSDWRNGIYPENLPKMKILRDGDSEKGDFPHMVSSIPVFSQRAVATFANSLRGKVKFRPIDCDGRDKYYIVQVMNLIDCLDYEKSVIKYYPHDPSRMMWIDKFVFKPELIANQMIFRIPESVSRIFVLKEFIERCETASLRGIGFSQVWDSKEQL